MILKKLHNAAFIVWHIQGAMEQKGNNIELNILVIGKTE